jgi:hypothetical protein
VLEGVVDAANPELSRSQTIRTQTGKAMPGKAYETVSSNRLFLGDFLLVVLEMLELMTERLTGE